MDCDALDEFPQASVAVQVRVMLYDPAQFPSVFTSSNVKVTLAEHSSVAVAAANSGTAGQLMVEGAGNAEITGGVLSIIVKIADVVEAFPQASFAVKVTTAEPLFPHTREIVEKSFVQLTAELLSVATAPPFDASQAFNSFTFPFPSHSTVLFSACLLMTGAVFSTFTVVYPEFASLQLPN